MREQVVYLWRTQWCGKWGTTRYLCTEEHIRKEHPEAIRIDSSRQVRQVPETPEEFATQQRQLSTSAFLKNKSPPGQ